VNAKEKQEQTKVISKETIHRLIRDIRDITKNPLKENGIYYAHDEEDMLKGYAMIVGASDTPYFGGYYFFSLVYPIDYPYSPPKVIYCTNMDNIRFNPNLYTNGKVCISLLNTWRGEQWTSCQTISTVLLTLCTLLCKDPLLNEPGITYTHSDFDKYNKLIEYKNIEIANMTMMKKKEGVFLPEFEQFYPDMEEHFQKNSPLLLAFLEEKKKGRKKTEVEKIVTQMYSMSAILDYHTLYQKYHDFCMEKGTLSVPVVATKKSKKIDSEKDLNK